MERDPYLVGAGEMLVDEYLEWVSVEKQLRAARGALSLVNRLQPGPFRARHVSRVMTKMNQLRARFNYFSKVFEGVRRD